MMRLDFICPGLGRCGTTTLDAILRQYSEIQLPNIKEPIFLQNFETSQKGVEWFAEKYYGISKNNPQDMSKIYGEINPSFGCTSAKRLKDTFGENVKIIIILRNPVKRLWSNFNYCINEGRDIMLDNRKDIEYLKCETRSEAFDCFIKDNFSMNQEKNYVYTGTFNHILSGQRYEFFCRQYLKFFPKQNIKIVLFEDFIQNQEMVCKEILEFIGVRFSKEKNYKIKVNEGNYSPKDDVCKEEIRKINSKMMNNLKNETNFEEAKKLHLQYAMQRKQYMCQSEQYSKDRPSSMANEVLENYFQTDRVFIEELLERDLTGVWFG